MSELGYRIGQVLREEASDIPVDLLIRITETAVRAVEKARREHLRRAIIGDLCHLLYRAEQVITNPARGPFQHELLADNIADLLTEIGWITRTDVPKRPTGEAQ